MVDKLEVGKLYRTGRSGTCFVIKEYNDECGDLVYDFYYLHKPDVIYTTLLHDAALWVEL